MSDTDDLLDEREETHGDYENTARIIQRFKRVLYTELLEREVRGQDDLSYVAAESIEMILHKIGRVISGKWDHPDHWEDISGYADLVSRWIAEEHEWFGEPDMEPDMDPYMDPDSYDWRADAIGSYHEAIRAIGEDVKAGRRELPEMFKPVIKPASGRVTETFTMPGADPGDETVF